MKFEKAYQIFIVLTDPLRLILFPLFILDPVGFVITSAAYATLEALLWLWTKRQDSFLVVLFSPLYGIFNTIARFVSVPLWIKNRYEFIFKKQFHKLVTGRALIAEYSTITLTICSLFLLSLWRITVLLIGLMCAAPQFC